MTNDQAQVSALSPVKQLAPPRWLSMPPAWRRGLFFPARRMLRTNAAGARPESAPVSALAHNHYVTNMRILNQILLRITVQPYVGTAAARQALYTGKTLQSFAGNRIDEALRQELDRQLAFMRRGENLGENRRRRLMLDQYLRYRVTPAATWFYSAPMVYQAAEAPRSQQESASFHSDIINEQQTNITRTTRYQREIEMAPPRTPSNGESAKEIADQVYRRVEHQLRMSRERSGRLF